jgi:hypothetical protein
MIDAPGKVGVLEIDALEKLVAAARDQSARETISSRHHLRLHMRRSIAAINRGALRRRAARTALRSKYIRNARA